MRPKERIPIILELIDIQKLLKSLRLFKFDGEIDKLEYSINKNIDSIKKYWEEHSELKFLVVLKELGYIPRDVYIPLAEDSLMLEKQGVDPIKFYMWNLQYDENNKPITNPYYKLCKDLTTKEIKATLRNNGKTYILGNKYKKIFNRILEERGDL